MAKMTPPKSVLDGSAILHEMLFDKSGRVIDSAVEGMAPEEFEEDWQSDIFKVVRDYRAEVVKSGETYRPPGFNDIAEELKKRRSTATGEHLAAVTSGAPTRTTTLPDLKVVPKRPLRKRPEPPPPADETQAANFDKGIESTPDPKPVKVTPGDGFHCTDTGNSQRIAARFGHQFRWVGEFGAWLCYDGKRWVEDKSGEVNKCGRKALTGIYAEASKASDPKKREELAKHAVRSESRRSLSDALEMFKSEPGISITAADLDTDPLRFNCQNGTLDLRTCTMLGHSPDDLITRVSGANFDDTATNKKFEKFITEALPDKYVRAFVQRVIGYSMTGETVEHILPYLLGPPLTGKTTLVELLLSIFGDYAMKADPDLLVKKRNRSGPRDDIAGLAGYRLVITTEVDQNGKLDERIMKQLTGGDTISARQLYRRSQQIKPTWKLLLVGNHQLRAAFDDDAVWRRIYQIPMEARVPDSRMNPYLGQQLTGSVQTRAAVLAWAFQGYLDWRGADTGEKGLRPPAAVINATDDYRRSQNPVGEWMEDCCTIGKNAGPTGSGDAWKCYLDWCEANKIRALSRRAFTDALKANQMTPDRNKSGRFWWGFALKAAHASSKGSRVIEGDLPT